MKGSIYKVVYKINTLIKNKDFLVVLLILLVGFGSFGLGKLSAIEERKTNVRIENSPQTSKMGQIGAVYGSKSTQGSQGALEEGRRYVASKNGTKYHHPWCPAALKISEKNKIWFSSQEEAEKAGYTPASNCKGL